MPISAFEASLPGIETGAVPKSSAPGVNIFGHLGAGVGLGTLARGLVDAAIAIGLPHTAIDIDEIHKGKHPDADAAAPHLVNIVQTNPDMLSMVFHRDAPPGYDDRFFKGHYNIGYWA